MSSSRTYFWVTLFVVWWLSVWKYIAFDFFCHYGLLKQFFQKHVQTLDIVVGGETRQTHTKKVHNPPFIRSIRFCPNGKSLGDYCLFPHKENPVDISGHLQWPPIVEPTWKTQPMDLLWCSTAFCSFCTYCMSWLSGYGGHIFYILLIFSKVDYTQYQYDSWQRYS